MAAIPSFILIPSRFGTLVLLWKNSTQGPTVQRMLLPKDGEPTEEMMRILRGTVPRSCPAIQGLGAQVTKFLEGEDVTFPLDILALEACSEFQQRVLRAEHGIPRGWVSTYGRIAKHLGAPNAARAVGNALSNNPFPILIPCHRAIRSNGELGGYQGGPEMKRALLAMEGVAVSPAGTALTDRLWY